MKRPVRIAVVALLALAGCDDGSSSVAPGGPSDMAVDDGPDSATDGLPPVDGGLDAAANPMAEPCYEWAHDVETEGRFSAEALAGAGARCELLFGSFGVPTLADTRSLVAGADSTEGPVDPSGGFLLDANDVAFDGGRYLIVGETGDTGGAGGAIAPPTVVSAGAQSWRHSFEVPPGLRALEGDTIAAVRDGAIVGGYALNGDDSRVWLARLGAGGEEVWNRIYDDQQISGSVVDSVALANGDVVVSGRTLSRNFWIARVDGTDGDLVWVNDLEGLFVRQPLENLLVRQDGSVMASVQAGAATFRLMTIEPDSGELSERPIDLAEALGDFASELNPLSMTEHDGSLLVLGAAAQRIDGERQFSRWLVRVTADGYELLSSEIPLPEQTISLVASADGGLCVAGRSRESLGWVGYLPDPIVALPENARRCER